MKRRSLWALSTAKAFPSINSETGSKIRKWKMKEVPLNHTTPLSTSIEADSNLTDLSSTKNVSTNLLTLIKKMISESTMIQVWNMRTFAVTFVMRDRTKWVLRNKRRVSTVRLCLTLIGLRTKCLLWETKRNASTSESVKAQSGHSAAATITQQTNTRWFAVFKMSRCPFPSPSPKRVMSSHSISSVSFTAKSTASMEPKTF